MKAQKEKKNLQLLLIQVPKHMQIHLYVSSVPSLYTKNRIIHLPIKVLENV